MKTKNYADNELKFFFNHFSIIPKIWIKKKIIFFRNLKSWKIGMPEKMTPKSQAKNKTPIPQYPFLTIFNSKKVSCKQIYNFKF